MTAARPAGRQTLAQRAPTLRPSNLEEAQERTRGWIAAGLLVILGIVVGTVLVGAQSVSSARSTRKQSVYCYRDYSIRVWGSSALSSASTSDRSPLGSNGPTA